MGGIKAFAVPDCVCGALQVRGIFSTPPGCVGVPLGLGWGAGGEVLGEQCHSLPCLCTQQGGAGSGPAAFILRKPAALTSLCGWGHMQIQKVPWPVKKPQSLPISGSVALILCWGLR